jgi:hypothetical protein
MSLPRPEPVVELTIPADEPFWPFDFDRLLCSEETIQRLMAMADVGSEKHRALLSESRRRWTMKRPDK